MALSFTKRAFQRRRAHACAEVALVRCISSTDGFACVLRAVRHAHTDPQPRCSRFEKTKAPEYYSKDLSELVEECLQKNPEKRPTAVELGDHPFLARCKLAIGLNEEVVDFLKLQKQKLYGVEFN